MVSREHNALQFDNETDVRIAFIGTISREEKMRGIHVRHVVTGRLLLILA